MSIVVFEASPSGLFSSNVHKLPSLQPSESKRDPVRFGTETTGSAARVRSSSRLCVASAACCCASRSRFASFNASRLCAFWRCFFVCGCDSDPTVAVPVPEAPPPSNAALLVPVKGNNNFSLADQHKCRQGTDCGGSGRRPNHHHPRLTRLRRPARLHNPAT